MNTVTNLRKIFTEQGIKGASKWKREDFDSHIIAAWFAAEAEAETRKPVAPVAVAAKPAKGTCEDCGRKVVKSIHPDICPMCYDYASWENSHQDSDVTEGHGNCPICHPELDKRFERREGRSRAGMEIVAKGTEIHKSTTFKIAAEACGWTVEITGIDGEIAATATRGDDTIDLVWTGRAYNYNASSAKLRGRDRKVRNLKEALRLI